MTWPNANSLSLTKWVCVGEFLPIFLSKCFYQKLNKCVHIWVCVSVFLCACITNIFFSSTLRYKNCGQLLNNIKLFNFPLCWNSPVSDPVSHSDQILSCKKHYHNLLCLLVTKDRKYIPFIFLIHYFTVIRYFCIVISVETNNDHS